MANKRYCYPAASDVNLFQLRDFYIKHAGQFCIAAKLLPLLTLLCLCCPSAAAASASAVRLWGMAVHTVRMSNLLLYVLLFYFLWLKIATRKFISFHFVCISYAFLYFVFFSQKTIGILILLWQYNRRFCCRKNKTPKQACPPFCFAEHIGRAARHARISNSIVYIVVVV